MLYKLKAFKLPGFLQGLPGRLKSNFNLNKLNKWMRRPAFLGGAGMIALIVIGLIIYGIWTTQQSPAQPIQFPHSLHLGFGVQCLYCHPGAWKGVSSGLPTITKCWGCHQQISLRNAELNILANAVQKQEPIQWVPVFILPDFVYFNHRPHIAAGVNCETCHGELSRMTVAQPLKKLNMGWCLHCHRTKFADDEVTLTRLTDCGTCHR